MLPKKENLEEKERTKHTVDSLYKDYVDDLFSYALGFGFDKQAAMDAIHDVFCRVCIREKDVQEIQNPKFYLLRALRNQLIDTYKLKRNYSDVLTERQREIIYLRYMQECSYEEIAEIMQISVPACRKLLYRTLLKLKHNNTLVLFYLLLSINVG